MFPLDITYMDHNPTAKELTVRNNKKQKGT